MPHRWPFSQWRSIEPKETGPLLAACAQLAMTHGGEDWLQSGAVAGQTEKRFFRLKRVAGLCCGRQDRGGVGHTGSDDGQCNDGEGRDNDQLLDRMPTPLAGRKRAERGCHELQYGFHLVSLSFVRGFYVIDY